MGRDGSGWGLEKKGSEGVGSWKGGKLEGS